MIDPADVEAWNEVSDACYEWSVRRPRSWPSLTTARSVLRQVERMEPLASRTEAERARLQALVQDVQAGRRTVRSVAPYLVRWARAPQ